MKKILIISGIEKIFFKKIIKGKFYFLDHKRLSHNKLLKIIDKDTIIFSVASGFVIKKKILKILEPHNLVNFHPGTIKYPGRDSCHFACYNNEKKFGAVVHYINDKIDSGPIIEELQKRIKKRNVNYKFYEKLSINCVKILFKKYFQKLRKSKKKVKISKKKWIKKKYKRKDFLKMMMIKKNENPDELSKRIRSFYTPGRKSLYTISKNKKTYLN